MPIFKVEIFKRLGAEPWENRYFIESGVLASAIPLAEDLMEAERTFHSEQVVFTHIRTSTVEEGDNQFHNNPINLAGLVPGSSTGGLLPLWNVVKLYLNKGYQRPDYKLYRGVLGEANSESGAIVAGLVTSINNAFAPIIGAVNAFLTDESGDLILSSNVDPFIRQRQLHRARRRSSSTPLVTPS